MNTNAARLTPDERLRKASRPDLRRNAPQAGDILASERSARADVFSINIISHDSEVIVARYSEAIDRARELARARRVDGWYTCDHIHYARIASYRS